MTRQQWIKTIVRVLKENHTQEQVGDEYMIITDDHATYLANEILWESGEQFYEDKIFIKPLIPRLQEGKEYIVYRKEEYEEGGIAYTVANDRDQPQSIYPSQIHRENGYL